MLVAMRNLFTLVACVALFTGGAASQSMPQGEHHHHDAAESMEVLGQVSFPTSCTAHSQEACGAAWRFCTPLATAKRRCNLRRLRTRTPAVRWRTGALR